MKFCLSIVLICFYLSGYAQYGERIGSGRPGAANGYGTVGKGVLQFQAGVQFDHVSDTRDSIKWNLQDITENLVVRFGLREHFEISAVVNHINSTEFINEDSGSIYRKGFNASMIRARANVNENLAFQIGISTRIRGKDYRIDYVAPRLRMMYNSTFGKNASLNTNIGTFWNGIDKKPVGFYVFSFSFSLTERFSMVAESYGDFVRTGINNYFDVGLGYNINPDLLLDLNAGWGENFPFKSYFVTVGVSYRFVTAFRSGQISSKTAD